MQPFVRHRGRAVAIVLLAAAVLLAFWPVLHHDFNKYDDTKYVTRNGRIKDGITPDSLRWAFTSFHASNWHPLTWISHMLDWRLYGASAGGHHATSLLLHLLNTWLLFLVLEAATGRTGRSAAVAALFAVHPLHVESVAWIAERKDVLSTFFWLLATLAYVRHFRSRGTGKSVAVAVLFGLGLMAKPMLVTLPFTLLLLDAWPLGRFDGPRAGKVFGRIPAGLLSEKIPLFVLAAASCVVTVLAQRGTIGSVERYPVLVRVANAAVSYAAYLVKTAWPTDLAVFYPYRGLAPAWQLAGSVAALALVTVAAFRLRRERPYLLVGWLWYLGTLVPVIGLVQVGKQSMADRYTYVPLVGIFVIVVWAMVDAIGALARSRDGSRGPAAAGGPDPLWLLVPAVAVVLPLMAATRAQLLHWRDPVTLFERAVAVAESDVAHANLGEALLSLDRNDEAEIQFRAALRMDPGVAEAHNGLGLILEGRGRLDEARQDYEEAVRIRPSYAIAQRNLGRLLAAMGRTDDAIAHDEAALALDPSDSQAHASLGAALASKGRLEDAVAHYEAALRGDPDSPETHNNLGSALSRLNRGDEAYRHFREAIRLRPDYAIAHYNLATELHFMGRFGEAWDEVRAARRLGFVPPQRFLDMLYSKMPEP